MSLSGAVSRASTSTPRASLSVADGMGISFSRQAGRLMATILTPRAPVVVQLPVPFYRGVTTSASCAKPLEEQMDIDVLQGLKAKTMSRAALETPGRNHANAKQLGLLAHSSCRCPWWR